MRPCAKKLIPLIVALFARWALAAPVTRGLGTPVQVRHVQESPRSALELRQAARRNLAAAER